MSTIEQPTTNNQQRFEHFQQSDFWKEVKDSMGNKTYDLSFGFMQTTKIPMLNKFAGYVPPIKYEEIDWKELYSTAKQAGCIFVTVDAQNKNNNFQFPISNFQFHRAKAIRLQKNCINDLTSPLEEQFSRITKKDRYAIRFAEKNGMKVIFSDSDQEFSNFLKVFIQTKKRQGFFGRDEVYLKTIWKIYVKKIKNQKSNIKNESDIKIYIANAYFGGEVQASMMLIGYKDTIYYPYGGSMLKHSKLFPTYYLAWEVIRKAKELGYEKLDWMGLEGNVSQGFSAFKIKFGGEIVKYADSVDLVINPLLYRIFKVARYLREKFQFIKNIV